MFEQPPAMTFDDSVITIEERQGRFHLVGRDVNTTTGDVSCLKADMGGHDTYEDAWFMGALLVSPELLVLHAAGGIPEDVISRAKAIARERYYGGN